MINHNAKVHLLEALQDADKKLKCRTEAKTGMGSRCMDCYRNTHTEYYPKFHIYKRSLCESCGRAYTELLEFIGALK